jgi:mannose-6-phosphate isomerase-like protein (cupin superfamily)
MNIKDYVIPKPWGEEYLFFENKDIGIWFLNIHNTKQTSLHCHPNKKTGLIVLDGDLEFTFLSNSLKLKKLDKIMIWPGVFHCSKSKSFSGTILLEVENPKNKYDLVRIEDEYHRENKGYEESNTWIKRNSSHLWLSNKLNSTLKYNNITFSIKIVDITKIEDTDIIVLLNESSINTKNNIPVCKVGDVVTGKTLKYLSNKFILKKTKAIIIHETL